MCLVWCLFKQKTAYEMRISDWSSDVCSSDLAIVEAGAVEAVAMRYLDRIDAGLLERLSDRAHMIDTVHVADGVHAVAQRHILDVELVLADVEAHAAALRAWMRCASSSPVALAAAVMMSRLPE